MIYNCIPKLLYSNANGRYSIVSMKDLGLHTIDQVDFIYDFSTHLTLVQYTTLGYTVELRNVHRTHVQNKNSYTTYSSGQNKHHSSSLCYYGQTICSNRKKIHKKKQTSTPLSVNDEWTLVRHLKCLTLIFNAA